MDHSKWMTNVHFSSTFPSKYIQLKFGIAFATYFGYAYIVVAYVIVIVTYPTIETYNLNDM
jgi:hypothetical protein